MTISITPVPAYPKQAVSLRVNDGHVHLGHGADFQYQLLDEDGVLVSAPGRNALTPEQYAEWGDDDTYVAKAVATNLGLTPA